MKLNSQMKIFTLFGLVVGFGLAAGTASATAQLRPMSYFRSSDAGPSTSDPTPNRSVQANIGDVSGPVLVSLGDGHAEPAGAAPEALPAPGLGLQQMQRYRSGLAEQQPSMVAQPVGFASMSQYRAAQVGAGYPDIFALSVQDGVVTDAAPPAPADQATDSTPEVVPGYRTGGFGALSAAPSQDVMARANLDLGASAMLVESDRGYAASVKTWASPDLFWQPLYFEEVAAERYGHHCGVLQPAVSAVQLLKNTVFLPYKVAAHPPFEAESGLGYQRPGNAVAPYREMPELSVRGLVGQGIVVGGLVFGL